jgi:adenylate cyclase
MVGTVRRGVGRMNPRLERKLRVLAVVVAGGAIAGLLFNVPQGRLAIVGVTYGMLMSSVLVSTEMFLLDGPMRNWLGSLPFTASLLVRSAIYVAIIAVLQWLQLGEFVAGLPVSTSRTEFWYGFAYSAVISVLFNLIYSITNLIGGREFLNFITGRYHAPPRRGFAAACISVR